MPYPRYQNLLARREEEEWSDDFFNQLISGIVGSGTTEPQSIERALAFDEGASTSIGDIGSEFSRLGGSRKLGKREQIPQGTYAMAKFPGMEHQIWAAEAGFIPKGYHWSSYLNETPDEKARREKAQKDWAFYQKQLVGMDGAPKRGWKYRR
jgi:hypothetical protein